MINTPTNQMISSDAKNAIQQFSSSKMLDEYISDNDFNKIQYRKLLILMIMLKNKQKKIILINKN